MTSLFDGPIAPQAKPKPKRDNAHIAQWQVVYNDGEEAMTREMNVMVGFTPPMTTQWDGRSYDRFYMNEQALSVYYRRAVGLSLDEQQRRYEVKTGSSPRVKLPPEDPDEVSK